MMRWKGSECSCNFSKSDFWPRITSVYHWEYKQNGWSVESVEQDKCGYDLLCANSSIEEHVEVKGIRGPDPHS
jgi:hypothetical protein